MYEICLKISLLFITNSKLKFKFSNFIFVIKFVFVEKKIQKFSYFLQTFSRYENQIEIRHISYMTTCRTSLYIKLRKLIVTFIHKYKTSITITIVVNDDCNNRNNRNSRSFIQKKRIVKKCQVDIHCA